MCGSGGDRRARSRGGAALALAVLLIALLVPSSGGYEIRYRTVGKSVLITNIPDPARRELFRTAIRTIRRDPEYYDALIEEAAKRYEVATSLVRAVIDAESGFDAEAVSSKGAMGLMQLMPGTAASLGVKDPFDPVQNIDGGVRYLREMLDMFDGELRLALAAYNAGPDRVREYGGIPPYRETRQYVQKILISSGLPGAAKESHEPTSPEDDRRASPVGSEGSSFEAARSSPASGESPRRQSRIYVYEEPRGGSLLTNIPKPD